jgi:hypothetical protein
MRVESRQLDGAQGRVDEGVYRADCGDDLRHGEDGCVCVVAW